MADDDKYVLSKGNPLLDVAAQKNSGLHAALIKEQEAYEKKRDSVSNAESIRSYNAHLAKSMKQDGLEYDSQGDLRSSGPNGYENSFDYRRKEQTKAERAHITERTWGKYNRGETLDMYGKKQRKKSQISESVSTSYGATKFKSPTLAGAASPIAGGISPWFQRGNPNMCGPVMVNLYASSGGVYQSNTQEAINLGAAINKIDSWGSA